MIQSWVWGEADDLSPQPQGKRSCGSWLKDEVDLLKNPDTRNNTLRSADVLFEFIDQEGRGTVDAATINAAAEILRPDRFDTRLEPPRTMLEDILVPASLGDRSLTRNDFIKHVRGFVQDHPADAPVVNVASDIAVAEGGIRRNWWLFVAALPLLLMFFLCLLDNMWKGRFMAVMMIILHANGVYCPWAHMMFANWDCRGMEAAAPQICDVGKHRDAPLDPARLYETFGCGFGQDLFADVYTRNGTLGGVWIDSQLRNCTNPTVPRYKDVDQLIPNDLWCKPIPDNILRSSAEYAAALEEAITPPLYEIMLLAGVLLMLPVVYLVTSKGRHWILLSFPGRTTDSLAAQGRLLVGARGRPNVWTDAFRLSSMHAKILLIGYYAASVGFIFSQFPIGPAPPVASLKADPPNIDLEDQPGLFHQPVDAGQPPCFFDWTIYPVDNQIGCTALEAYYSGGLATDAAMLNLSLFLVIGVVLFFTLWNAGELSRDASAQVHRESRQLHGIHVRMEHKTKRGGTSLRQLPATKIVDDLDLLVRYSRQVREGTLKNRVKSLLFWAGPSLAMGTAIRGPFEVFADEIRFREGSFWGFVILMCNMVAISAVFYCMTHVYRAIANDFADMTERTKLVTLMLSPASASYRQLPAIRVDNIHNLYGWLKIRRFVSRWADWRQLENAKVAVGLLLLIALALGIALWFIVIGKPFTTSSCAVMSWTVWVATMVLHYGDDVLCQAIALTEELDAQSAVLRRRVLELQLMQSLGSTTSVDLRGGGSSPGSHMPEKISGNNVSRRVSRALSRSPSPVPSKVAPSRSRGASLSVEPGELLTPLPLRTRRARQAATARSLATLGRRVSQDGGGLGGGSGCGWGQPSVSPVLQDDEGGGSGGGGFPRLESGGFSREAAANSKQLSPKVSASEGSLSSWREADAAGGENENGNGSGGNEATRSHSSSQIRLDFSNRMRGGDTASSAPGHSRGKSMDEEFWDCPELAQLDPSSDAGTEHERETTVGENAARNAPSSTGMSVVPLVPWPDTQEPEPEWHDGGGRSISPDESVGNTGVGGLPLELLNEGRGRGMSIGEYSPVAPSHAPTGAQRNAVYRYILDELEDTNSTRVHRGLMLMGIPLNRQMRALVIVCVGVVLALLMFEARKLVPISTSSLLVGPDTDGDSSLIPDKQTATGGQGR